MAKKKGYSNPEPKTKLNIRPAFDLTTTFPDFSIPFWVCRQFFFDNLEQLTFFIFSSTGTKSLNTRKLVIVNTNLLTLVSTNAFKYLASNTWKYNIRACNCKYEIFSVNYKSHFLKQQYSLGSMSLLLTIFSGLWFTNTRVQSKNIYTWKSASLNPHLEPLKDASTYFSIM